MSDIKRWIDLSKFGVYLGDQRMADGKQRLILLDMNDIADKEALDSIGFVPVTGSPRYSKGIFYLSNEDQRLSPKALARALGLTECPMVDIEAKDIDLTFRQKISEKFGMTLDAMTQRSRVLGTNADGDTVYESTVGRFIRTSVENGIVENSSGGAGLAPSKFLRATDNQELSLCADGFVWRIRQGQKTNWNDVKEFAKVVFNSSSDVEAESLHKLQEAIEASAYRAFSRVATGLDKDTFDNATSFYFGLPTANIRTSESVALQQYSTPVPLSLVAQHLLIGNDVIEGKTVNEPTAGNGGLINLLPKDNVKIYAMELDDSRIESLKKIEGIEVAKGDATLVNQAGYFNVENKFDYSIVNPPFGGMDVIRDFDKLKGVKKLDLYICLKSLESRKDQGRSVFILGADNRQSDGEISGGTKKFCNYIYDHYDVKGFTEVDGRLYSRQGASFNVRVMVVGDKRPAPIEVEVPEKLNIISSYEDLWTWHESVIEKYKYQIDLNADAKISISAHDIGMASPSIVPKGESIVKKDEVGTAAAPALKERKVNEFQVPYQALSKVGVSSTMIPINMAAATYEALHKLQEEHGDIDQYVARKLKYDVEELGRYYSPEQVDAIGLAIKSLDEGRGIINADQTGIGKGRFVASMLRYAKLDGKTPIFVTIKPELFTDIFRDINDIGSLDLFKNVFIFNDGENVKKFGTQSDVLFPATLPIDRKKAIQAGEVPEGTDIVLATYSQFMRDAVKNPKAGLLTSLCRNDGILLLDESHVAAGESNISLSIGEAVANSSSTIYSSATPLKGVTNFSIYNRIFPASVDLKALPDTLKAGGEALQEAISTNMARDGVLVRREHDFSMLTFATVNPDEKVAEKNREVADKLAAILASMAYLAGDVSEMVGKMNDDYKKEWKEIPEKDRAGSRMQASSMNFGSRLFSINRQFLLGIKIDSCVDTALKALSEGRKPVIAVENTGESLLRQVITRRAGVENLQMELDELDERGRTSLTEEQKKRREFLVESINDNMRNVVLDEPPQFRELLEIMLDRIGVIKVQGRYGDVSIERPSSKEYLEEEEYLRGKIAEFPDMPLTPLDVIKAKMIEKGHPFTEVSGRTVSIAPDKTHQVDDSRWNVSFHKKADPVASVAGFQNGKYDVIAITRSGSTGISLHATNRFEDSDIRQRDFIVLQKAANIAEFLQWMGRVNRKDQVVPPIISSIESALPAEQRITMMHNSKLRKLSANTTSNRDNANIEGENCDLLNDVGDYVALNWLIENPDIAARLDITLPSDSDEENTRFAQDCAYINKLLGRLMLVPVETQERILKAITQRFEERVSDLTSRGQNPFKVDVYDWNASVVGREELQSSVLHPSGSTFDEPIEITTVEYLKNVYPIRTERLQSMIEAGNELFVASGQVDESGGLGKFKAYLDSIKAGYIRSQLPAKYRESEEPLSTIMESHDDIPGAKNAKEKADFLIKNLDCLKPGRIVPFDDLFAGERFGVIVSVSLPAEKDDFFLLSKYRVRVVFPGEDAATEITMATLKGQGKDLTGHRYASANMDATKLAAAPWQRTLVKPLINSFDSAPDGQVKQTRHLLQGNIFRACELATKQKLGYPILFTDTEGNRQRAILLKDRVTPEMVKSLPMGFDAKDMALYVQEHMTGKYQTDVTGYKKAGTLAIYDSPVKDMKPGEGIMLTSMTNGNFTLCIPGSKARSEGLIQDGAIFDIGGKTEPGSLRLKLSGTRNAMQSVVKPDELYPLLVKLQKLQYVGKFYVPEPSQEVLKVLKERHKVEFDLTRKAKVGGVSPELS